MSIAGVTRELLVRYLDVWAPTALHTARRATFAQAWAGPADLDAAEAALRVFAEFADRLRSRKLAMVVVAPQTAELTRRLDDVQSELGTPPALGVHPVAGPGHDLLPAALGAAGAAGAPILAYLDLSGADAAGAVAAVAAGRPAEVLLLTAAGDWPGHRDLLRGAGFPLTAGVELVERTDSGQREGGGAPSPRGGADASLVAFATSLGKNLEAFKNSLWAVDEYAGVRFRDPNDPDGHLLDISLSPHRGPLRRELLSHLRASGECTVAELRRFTLSETVYRSSDTAGALTSLLTSGAVTRRPLQGRLTGDVIIIPGPAAG